jgi:hypothetical protein
VIVPVAVEGTIETEKVTGWHKTDGFGVPEKFVRLVGVVEVTTWVIVFEQIWTAPITISDDM